MDGLKKQYAIILVILLALVFYIGARYGENNAYHGEGFIMQGNNKSNIGVHLKGAVTAQGYYELPVGARINDLLKAAPPLEDADISELNLAAYLIDGTEIIVPYAVSCLLPAAAGSTDKEAIAAAFQTQDTATDSEIKIPADTAMDVNMQPAGKGIADIAPAEQNDKLNINSADIGQLQTLKGIGAIKAEAIVNYRENHGAFKKIADIKKVAGIGAATFEKIKDAITIE